MHPICSWLGILLIPGALLLSVTALGDETENKLMEFEFNAREVQRQFDVKCLVTAYVQVPDSMKSSDSLKFSGAGNVRFLRYTANESTFRVDASSWILDETFSPSRMLGESSELMIENKFYSAGIKKERDFMGTPRHLRIDPIWMLMLTADSQANGKGATESAAMDIIEDSVFVESMEGVGRELDYGVWISKKNRLAILELGFEKGRDMPSSVRYFYSTGNSFPEGSEFGRKYLTSGREVSSAKIAWKEIDELWVPERVEMIRGKGGGIHVTQYWDFMDWSLGTNVDLTRLDPEIFKSGPVSSEILFKLREQIGGKHEK